MSASPPGLALIQHTTLHGQRVSPSTSPMVPRFVLYYHLGTSRLRLCSAAGLQILPGWAAAPLLLHVADLGLMALTLTETIRALLITTHRTSAPHCNHCTLYLLFTVAV